MRDSARSPIATSPRPGCSGTRRLLGCWRSTAPARVTTPGDCGPFSWRSCGRRGGMWTLGNPGLAPEVSETGSVIANPGPKPGDTRRHDPRRSPRPDARAHPVPLAPPAHAGGRGGDARLRGETGRRPGDVGDGRAAARFRL